MVKEPVVKEPVARRACGVSLMNLALGRQNNEECHSTHKSLFLSLFFLLFNRRTLHALQSKYQTQHVYE